MIPISLSLGEIWEIFNRTKALSRESGGDPTVERESRRCGVHVAENLKCMENGKAGPQLSLETEGSSTQSFLGATAASSELLAS